MAPSERPLEIAIIGAGLAGVTLALALTRNNPNLHLTIFESRRKFSEISNGVGCKLDVLFTFDFTPPSFSLPLLNTIYPPKLTFFLIFPSLST